MRWMLVAVAALWLSGCADVDFFGDASNTATPASADTTGTAAQPPGQAMAVQAAPPQIAPAQAMTAAPTTPSAHCAKIARQRAGDSAYSGEDPDTQQAVYDRTYADCVAWDARHAL